MTTRTRRPLQPRLDVLEGRTLLNAGGLDTTFRGPVGYATLDLGRAGDQARTLLVQPWDGKIVVGSSKFVSKQGYDFMLARYKPDGTLDSSFGSGGVTTVNFSGYDDLLAAVAVVPGTHKLLVAGQVNTAATAGSASAFGLARLNENGSLDSTFGSKGIASFTVWKDTSTSETPRDLAFDSQGRILVAGGGQNRTKKGEAYSYTALIRTTANGALDTSFGSQGIVLGSKSAGNNDGWGNLAVAQDNSLTVVGTSLRQPVIARFTASGASAGSQVLAAPAGLSAQGVLAPDRQVVTAQPTDGAGDPWEVADSVSVFRDRADGSLDTSFAGGQVVSAIDLRAFFVSHLASFPELVNYYGGGAVPAGHTLYGNMVAPSLGVAFDAQGRIVVSGGIWLFDRLGNTDPDPRTIQAYAFLIRYGADGVPDASFGIDGVAATAFRPGPFEQGLGPVAFQADGKIVAAGSLDVGTGAINNDVLVARFLGGSAAPASLHASGPMASAPAAVSTSSKLLGILDLEAPAPGRLRIKGRSRLA